MQRNSPPFTLINPAKLDQITKQLLLQLLENEQFPDFVECKDPISCEYVTYFANLNLVVLTHTLIRYPSTKYPNDICYAVVNHDDFARGARHAVYLSKYTLHVIHRENNIDLVCKKKSDNKYRAVKRPFLPADDRNQLKWIADGLLDRSEQNTLLKHEAAMLRHSTFFHVKPVITSTGNSSPALIMRYVNGYELGLIYEDFSFEQRLNVAIQIGKEIETWHANNIIHRDIKIENVMIELDENNHPRKCILVDFELAHEQNDERALELAGTPPYIAPEIYSVNGSASFSSDVFALTVILKNYLFKDRDNLSADHQTRLDEICKCGLEADPAKRATLPYIMKSLFQLQTNRNMELVQSAKNQRIALNKRPRI